MPKKPPSPLALIQAATADAAHVVGQSFGMDFNSLNPLASVAAQQQSTRLVREVTQATRQGLATAVTRGLEEGLPPRVLARTIKPMIGLTSKQTQAVFNARASWASGGLSGTLLEKRTARYAEKLLKARAMNIARTETIFSLNAGQTAAWEHAANQGRLQPERTQKKWAARSGSERTCPICGRMNGQIVGFRDLFVTPLGRRLSHPPAHPQCRCAVVLIFNKKTQRVSLPKRMKVAAERDTGVRPIPQNRWVDDPARNNVLSRSTQTLDEIVAPPVASTNQNAIIYINPKPSDPDAIEAARRKARSEASMRSRAKKKARLAGLTASEAMDMTGLTVRYAKPLRGEKAFRFKVLEDRGDRLLLQVIGWHNPILVPTEVVARSAVTIVR